MLPRYGGLRRFPIVGAFPLTLPGPQTIDQARLLFDEKGPRPNAPAARVLNIVGASHKGYYDAYLDQMSDVQIIDALAVLK